MAIARKPKKTATEGNSTANEKAIDALISKGGSSTKAQQVIQVDDDAIKPILLRLYQSHINDIEGVIEQLPKRQRLSRHAYIIQAVEEKLQRDKGKRK